MQMAGIILLTMAAMAVVIRLRTDEKRHLQALRCAAAIARHTARKIRLYGTPTADILCDFDNGSGFRVPKNRNREDFKEAVAPVYDCLRGPERKLFSEFCDKLGQSYKDDALKLCEYTLECLRERCAQAESAYPSRVKLYTALPILSAVSLFVLFL